MITTLTTDQMRFLKSCRYADMYKLADYFSTAERDRFLEWFFLIWIDRFPDEKYAAAADDPDEQTYLRNRRKEVCLFLIYLFRQFLTPRCSF